MPAAPAPRAPASASRGARADPARLRHDPGRGGRTARARRGRSGRRGRRHARAPHGGVAGRALSRRRVAARPAGHRRRDRTVRRGRSRRVGLRGRLPAVRAHDRGGHLPAAHIGARPALGAAVRRRAAGVGLGRAAARPRAGQRPWSFPWTAPTSGTATTGCWLRCCGHSCAGASPRSKQSSTGARASGTPTTTTSMRRSAMPRPQETFASPAICCGATPSATSLRATTRGSAVGSVTSPTSRWRATRRWPSWPPTPTWPTATAITLSTGPRRPHARSTTCRPGAGRRPSRPASQRCAQRSPATACSACATMPHAPTHSMRRPALHDRWIGCSRARRATCSVHASARTSCWRRVRGEASSARRASTRCASHSSPCWRSTATTGAWPPSWRTARARRSSASGWRHTRR